MMNNYIKTPFRFYAGYIGESYQHVAARCQVKYRLDNWEEYDFRYIANPFSISPFQAYIPRDVSVQNDAVISSVLLVNSVTGAATDITDDIKPNIALFQTAAKGIWHIYKGNAAMLNGRVVASGMWYLAILTAANRYLVSEDFHVQCGTDRQFEVQMVWGNDKDLADIIYQTGYINWLYVKNRPREVEPKITEEGDENEKGVFIASKTIYVDQYSLDLILPDYLVEAITAIRQHKQLYITYPGDFGGNSSGFECRITDIKVSWQTETVAQVSIKLERVQNRKVVTYAQNHVQSALVAPFARFDQVRPALANYAAVTPGTWFWIPINITANDDGFSLSVIPTDVLKTTIGGNKVNFQATGFWWQVNDDITDDSVDITVQDPYGAQSTASLQIVTQPLTTLDTEIELPYIGGQPSKDSPYNPLGDDWIPNTSPLTISTGLKDCHTDKASAGGLFNKTGNKVLIKPDGSFTFYYNNPAAIENWFRYTVRVVALDGGGFIDEFGYVKVII